MVMDLTRKLLVSAINIVKEKIEKVATAETIIEWMIL